MASSINAARNDDSCSKEPPATCYPDDCRSCHCLGPENYGVNAPVCPRTCNGDFLITVAGFYWNAHQGGMNYALENQVVKPGPNCILPALFEELNNLIGADYESPDFKWDFGFKLGLAYCSPCDGWDFGAVWTWYRGKATDHIEAEKDDNRTLLPIWSAFTPAQSFVLYATEIETHWKLELNLVDIELGRGFWTSKYLSARPHVGLRIASIKQDFDIEHKGGSWSANTYSGQKAFNNEVDLKNDFKGVGMRAGLDSLWNFGCGLALYGNLAASVVYGRFSFDHDEENREAKSPHSKINVLKTENSFRASRAMFDLALGLQWSTMFCDCKYGFTAMLGWEHHLFFNQNQMWRVNRIGALYGIDFPNNTGENIYHERRGNLYTQGWTLTFKFEF